VEEYKRKPSDTERKRRDEKRKQEKRQHSRESSEERLNFGFFL
jgi:hypothetical protein